MDNHLSPRPSKSQRKREMLAVQDLGKTLVELPAPQLAQIPLEPELHEAIQMARRLKSHEAIRRQLQYIGKLMRHVDISPIQTALQKVQGKDQAGKAEFHAIERWRDRLIGYKKDEAALEFLEKYPDTDAKQLSRFIHEATLKKPGAETALFRFLREIIANF